MATIPPVPPGPSQPPPMQTDTAASASQLSWEGDKMFNIYIYDYCYKRGFRNTARELMQEAEIVSDPTPPINARQGLLFEWWSVFWVLFQAKSNGGGSDDGLVYVNQQAIQQQQQQAQRNQRGLPPGQLQASLPLGNQPLQPPQLQQQQQQPPHQNMARLPNGLPAGGMQSGMTRPQSAYMANGAMPNGAGMGGQQQQPGGPGVQMNFGGMGGHPPPPQANGVSAPGPGGPQQQLQPGQQPSAGGPSGQPMQFSVLAGQRQPIMNGLTPQQQQQQQQQQRGGGPNGGLGPFQSPTMAHSPGQPPQPSQQPPSGAPGQQAPMAQLGPSPHMAHMNRGGVPMVPPQPSNGGPLGMAVPPPPQQQPGGQPQGGPPTPGYQPGQTPNPSGRPPSRSNTPRSGMLPQASPSMAARQTPGGGNPMIGVVPGMPGMNMAGMMGGGPGSSHPAGVSALNHENSINQEIMAIPQNALNALKIELGFGDKDFGSLSMNEKNRILGHWRTKTPGGGPKPGPMQNLGPQGQQPQRAGVPPPPQQRAKRSSTSPGEEHETLPRNESSPPDRKRVRRSPGNTPIMGYPPHQGQPQPPLPGQPGQLPQRPGQPPQQQQPNPEQMQQMNMMLAMRAQHPMNSTMGIPSGPGPGGPMQQQPGQPQLHQGGLMGMHPGPGPMMPTQQQQQQQQMHMYRMKQEPFNPLAQPTAGATSQFSSSPLNRIGQSKPPMTMMPPPSPAQGGPAKGMKTEGGDGPGNNPSNGQPQPTHNPDGSPRNAPTAGGQSNGGTAPPTPVPTNRPNPQQQPQQQQPQSQPPPPPPTQQTQPPPPQQNPNPMAGMNLSMLGMTGTNMNLAPDIMFDTFPGMEDFDAMNNNLFTRDNSTDINFERDFGQWFNNPDDLTGGLGPD